MTVLMNKWSPTGYGDVDYILQPLRGGKVLYVHFRLSTIPTVNVCLQDVSPAYLSTIQHTEVLYKRDMDQIGDYMDKWLYDMAVLYSRALEHTNVRRIG